MRAQPRPTFPLIAHRLRALGAAAALCLAGAAGAVTIELQQVGNAGNPADPYSGSLYGSVGYAYSIGKFDVTVDQYVEFLNVNDPTGANALRLYATGMSDATYGGIVVDAAAAAGRKYAAMNGRGRWPATFLAYASALRFANWMHNGQAAGATETGAYTLGALDASGAPLALPASHEAGARWWVPTENEWYKAAYHKAWDTPAVGWFEYPTSSSTAPAATLPTNTPNSANFEHTGGFTPATQPPLAPTPVGAYAGTTSPYGAFDMAGNVFQWTEAQPCAGMRGIRGGSFAGSEQDMIATARYCADPRSDIYRNVGLRLASSQPGLAPPPPATTTSTSPSTSLPQLQVKVSGGKGTIRGLGGRIDCGKTCRATFTPGEWATLSVTPEPGFRFVGWSGACAGVTTSSCTVQLKSSTTVEALLTK